MQKTPVEIKSEENKRLTKAIRRADKQHYDSAAGMKREAEAPIVGDTGGSRREEGACTMERTEERRAYFRESYAMYKAHGICVVCRRADALRGLTVCAECRAYKREHNAKWAAEHQEVARQYNAERYARWKASGKCVKCGVEEPRPGKATCTKCARRTKWYDARRYQPVWRAPGQCLRCAEPAVEGYSYCAEHLQKQREVIARNRAKGIENTPWRQDMWPRRIGKRGTENVTTNDD